MNKIGIIDHVGKKSGMDFYDVSLSKELDKEIKVYIFSNFEKKTAFDHKTVIKNTFGAYKKEENSINKAKYFFLGYLRSFIKSKSYGIKTVILHSFSYELKDLIVYTIARILGLRILLIAHDISGFAKNDSKVVKRIILKYLTEKILVHNDFSKRILTHDNFKEERIITIRLGGYIELVNLIDKNEAQNKLGLSANYKYVLFFGQIKEVKGLDLLIEAFSKIDTTNARLIIAGKVWNDNYEKYTKLIDQLNLNDKIIFHKRFIPNKEMDLLFSASDLVVIPYRKIYQSAVLLNALSYPSVVLCSDLEPNREVVKDGENGFLFQSGNVQSLSKKLSYVLNIDNNLKDKIKRDALATVKGEHSWKYSARKIINYLKND